MANILEELGGNKVITDKKPCFIERSSNGIATKIHKLEYLTNYQEAQITKQIYEQEVLREIEEKKFEQEKQKEIEEKNKELKKEKVLRAFEYFLRDFKEDLLDYTYEEYEKVVEWYKEYIKNNDIEIISYLNKYL